MQEAKGTELAAVRDVFRAVARTVVPEASELDPDGWGRVEAVVENAIAQRPPAMRRQLRLLLRAVQWLPVPRWGRRFTSLDEDRRRRLLGALQDAPFLLARRGLWGLRTLVFMGYYGQPSVQRDIGYGARLRGRRDREEPIPGRGAGELPASTPAPGA